MSKPPVDPVVAHVLKALADRATARREDPAAVLAHKRALKAKHMATWRAKQKKLKEQGNG